MREKYNYPMQIAYLNSKGVKFEIVDEVNALNFISHNTYLFKLKAYAKNYQKDNYGKYINLDFAYLQELSTLDMYLRQIVMKMSLNCEHCLKTMLIHDVCENPKEDGFDMVNIFFDNYCNIERKIDTIPLTSMARNIIDKYRDNLAVWDLMEVLSFGDFILLYTDYYQEYPSVKSLVDYVESVKILRDAAAHNTCMINDLKIPFTKHEIKNKIKSFLDKETSFDHRFTRNMMSNNFINNFVTFLYVFDNIVDSDDVKYYNFKELYDFCKQRLIYHQDYFIENGVLVDAYRFIDAIVEVYYLKHLQLRQ